MEIRFHRRFDRDLSRTGDAATSRRVERVIEELRAAPNITEVIGVRRLRTPGQHYRIRIGDYRVGITMDGDVAVLRRFLPRRDFYRYFP